MKAIDFVVRTSAGAVDRGSISEDKAVTRLGVGADKEISLNLSQGDLRAYSRDGSDLRITLADGRVVVLQGYFNADGEPASRLFISADGVLNEVSFSEGNDGVLFANYGPTEIWGKWSPSDELIFIGRPEVVVAEAAATGDEVSMLGMGLIGGGGLIGTAGAGAAIIGGGLIGGGGGGEPRIVPTVDDPDVSISIGGDDTEDPTITVTGTAEPGSTVTVTIGSSVVTVITGPDGHWQADFTGEDFPEDGDYSVHVHVTDTDGTETDLGGPDISIDLIPPPVDVTDGTMSVDDVVNRADHADGVTVSGTGEAGATVTVTIGTATNTTTVTEGGTWEVTFGPDQIPGGEYETDVVVVSTDTAGNTTTVTDRILIDTVPNDLVILGDQVEGDGTVSAAERSDGVTVTGTSEPGATVTVTVEGVTRETVVNTDGSWSVTFDPGTLPDGEYEATVTATTTDAVGNSSSASATITVDTRTSVSISDNLVETDDVVNASEASDGFVLTGTAEAGSTVTVTMGGATVNATVAANGSWTATIPASAIAAGEYDATVTVTATDAAGNTATATRVVHVDTEGSVTISSTPVEGDDVISGSEAADGVTLTGTAEPGSSVEVTLGGVTRSATVAQNGSWSMTFGAGDLPTGTGTLTVTATATDTIAYDTEGSVTLNTATVEGEGVVNAAERADGVTLTGTAEPGSSVQVNMGEVVRNATVEAQGNWSATFAASDLPSGETTLAVTATATDTAGNVTSTTGNIAVDTLVRDFRIESEAGGTDNVVNAAEAAEGLTVTGQTEPGSTVVVRLGSVEHSATVAADGRWSVNFLASEIPAGEYTTTLTATATDRAGNSQTLSDTVRIDTDAGILTISSAPVVGDDIINRVEASDGVTLRGTANPGAVVEVTMGSVTHVVTADANGQWAANFLASEIPAGTYTANITATTTDAAGNSRTVTDTVRVDTAVDNFDLSDTPIETNNEVNFAEAADGVVLNGTTEPGSTVFVTLGGVTRQATVDANGNWTVTFEAGDIAGGEYEATMVVTTTDPAGNVETTTSSVSVDTLVNQLDIGATPSVVNAAGVAAGLTLTGQVEAGSTVVVYFQGTPYAATVDANGNWSVDIPPGAIPAGEYNAEIRVEATDAAGNTDSITQTLAIDTVAPDGPIVEAVNFDRTGDIRDISVQMSDDQLGVGHVQADGSVQDLTADLTLTDIGVIGETNVLFGATVPDGSHLVVSRTDDAGNMTGTYLVVNESGTSNVTIGNANLGNFQIDTIDLSFAENSSLTINEADLRALSSATDSVTVYGGADDRVTITGATLAGQTTNEAGDTFNVYSLGGDATVLVDDEITNVVI